MKRSVCVRIFTRDQFTCQVCQKQCPPVYDIPAAKRSVEGRPEYLIVDHKDSSLGDAEDNLQTLCWRCNSRKAGRGTHAAKVLWSVRQLGRTTTAFPAITSLLGANASIFIGQFIYWTPRANRYDRAEGWIFKSVEEIQEETGLSYKEQTRARQKLVDARMLHEQYDRTNHRLEFRVNPEGFIPLFHEGRNDEHLPNGHMPERADGIFPNGHMASDQRADGTLPKVISYKETEITTEITTQKSCAGAPRKPKVLFPDEFALTFDMQKFASDNGVGKPQEEFAAFTDFHRSKGNRFVDWVAAWRTWVRQAHRFAKDGGSHGKGGEHRAARNGINSERPEGYDDKSRAERLRSGRAVVLEV